MAWLMAATVAYHGRHPRRTDDDSELMVITAWTIGVPKVRRGRLRLMTVNALGAGTKKPRPHLSVEPGSIWGRVV